MSYKKILTIQDISCVGQCSLTVALPILSACGHETCILPSAVLSTHTAGFSGFTFRDLTDDIPAIQKHWQKENITFDAIYTGYLGSTKQIDYVKDILNTMGTKDCKGIVDPAMADNGKLYPLFDQAYVEAMKVLCADADILLPNITEACLLLDIPYKTDFSDNEIRNMLISLSEIGSESVIITGIHRINKVGAAYYSKKNSAFGEYFTKSDPNNYPGAGDIFSSIVLASFLQKQTLRNSVAKACDFILHASEYTTSLATPIREGLAIEALLSDLICDRKANQ